MSGEVVEERILSSNLRSHNMTPQAGEATKARRIRRKKAKAAVAADVDTGSKKRKLSEEQVKFLEMSFGEERKLESGRKVHLAAELGLEPQQVAVWFQNRRARHKGKQVEEAYLNLKSLHDAILLQKCHLETEVLRLKEKLLESEEEIRKLSMGISNNGASGHKDGKLISSPSSSVLSFSTVTYQPLLVELGMELEAEALQAELMYYIHEVDDCCNINYFMEWPNIS